MLKKISFFIVLFVGFPALVNGQDLGPSVTPKRICDDTYMTIAEPTGLGLSLAVVTPNKTQLTLVQYDGPTILQNYWTDHFVNGAAVNLLGIAYDNGRPIIRPVFKEKGTYKFYFAKNLETEIENTVSFTTYVEYLGEYHPDCTSD